MATVTPGKPPVFNLPNQLTAGRFVLAIVLFVLIAFELWLACIVVFALAAFTDWLDGYLVRHPGTDQHARPQLRPARGQGADVRGLYLLVASWLKARTRLAVSLDGHGGGGSRTAHHRPAQLHGESGVQVRSGLAG